MQIVFTRVGYIKLDNLSRKMYYIDIHFTKCIIYIVYKYSTQI